ncbi:MAG: hypothetical protein LBR10_05320 [Prevotellaceae bacterium]|jgi:hypothetical protein|nr:hypothetical protein [Prevotellaceae bacterium]
MNQRKNPFEYEGANNLPDEDIIDFYIEDYNFSRFIQSKKNIFLLGERGSGKTMTLLYNSFKIQYKKSYRNSIPVDFSKIGIHIPCKNPLFYKPEYLLLDDEFKRSVVGEHYLTLTIVNAIVETLENIPEIIKHIKNKDFLYKDIEYILGIELNREYQNYFTAIKKYIQKEIIETQKYINNYGNSEFYNNTMSFASLAIPFIEVIKQIDILANSHFLLMVDDAQDMNLYQIKSLNSWIAYRNQSHFSFKVATTKVNRPLSITSTGGSIFEGHDYLSIDMEKPYQKKGSDFYEMATNIIAKRLENIGISPTPEEFFPENKDFTKAMLKAEEKVKEEALKRYPNIDEEGNTKKINDYVYKYKRAEYYRSRAKKANLPPYSGFSMIVDISTGVIRNLLDPCYWMYDAQLSSQKDLINSIPPHIQDEIIINRSKNLWERMRNLDKQIENCDTQQAKCIYQLFDNLMILFKRRLLEHKSEPRAIVFSISLMKQEDIYVKLTELLDIARKAQLLYTRIGNAKDLGKQEKYYVPNRLLFPSRGLDPHGQYSRVSLKVTDLWNAAINNALIPFSDTDKEEEIVQKSLFDNNYE